MKLDYTRSFELLARSGYAARGVVYAVVGLLTLAGVIGIGGGSTDSRGALSYMVDQPFGQVLLGILAVGLAGYALWRLAQGLFDLEHRGTEGKGLMIRAGAIFSGVLHVGLAVWAANLSLGTGNEASDGGRGLIAWTLNQSGGAVVIYLAALALAIVGVMQMVRGYHAKFMRRLQDLPPGAWPKRVGQIGLVARGIAFVVLAYLFFETARRHASGPAASGLEGAFDWVGGQAYGQVLLAILAVGFVAFAAYSFIEAAYRRIRTERLPFQQRSSLELRGV